MKKISIVATKQNKKVPEHNLTVGLDLGDRSSWYCVLDEAGEVVLEQRLSTTPKAMREVFGGMRGVGSPWKRGCIRRG
jgi:transposase